MEGYRVCPFCPARMRDDSSFSRHVKTHKPTEAVVKMTVNGQNYLLERVNGTGNMYECPECNDEGKASAVYAHFVKDHLNIIHRRGYDDDTDDRPSKKLRTEPLPSPPTSSPLSRTPFSSVQNSQTAVRQDRSLRTSTPGPSRTSMATVGNDSQPTRIEVYVADALGSQGAKPKLKPNASIAERMKKLNHHNDIVGLKLVGDEIFSEHATQGEIFAYLAGAMANVVHLCPIHQLLKPNEGNHAHLPYKCLEQVAQPSSFFKCVFTKGLNADGLVTCVRCWTPTGTSSDNFDHASSCKDNQRANWEGWWRWIPFLVWRIEELRKVVFVEMGIPQDHFREMLDYVRWLVLPCGWKDRRRIHAAVSNLFAVVYTYFRLFEEDKCRPPEGGFCLDEKLPVVCSSDPDFNNSLGYDI